MAAPKRTKGKRELDLVTLTDLYVRGHTQYEIADLLGVTRSQIQYDLRKVHNRWRDTQIANINEAKVRELEKLDAIEQEAWSAWRRSIGRKSKVKNTTDADGTKSERIHWRDSGDAAYLTVIARCVEKRCDILGLNTPKESTGTNPVTVNIQNNVASLTADERRAKLLDHIAALRDRGADSGDRGTADAAIDADANIPEATGD